MIRARRFLLPTALFSIVVFFIHACSSFSSAPADPTSSGGDGSTAADGSGVDAGIDAAADLPSFCSGAPDGSADAGNTFFCWSFDADDGRARIYHVPLTAASDDGATASIIDAPEAGSPPSSLELSLPASNGILQNLLRLDVSGVHEHLRCQIALRVVEIGDGVEETEVLRFTTRQTDASAPRPTGVVESPKLVVHPQNAGTAGLYLQSDQTGESLIGSVVVGGRFTHLSLDVGATGTTSALQDSVTPKSVDIGPNHFIESVDIGPKSRAPVKVDIDDILCTY